ncbi:predicted protein [Histoplasma mississippiense (nom. inval.)]|uniref:predicted protein n=1 Tax=Ajellomyces capsulatus (strain NAm1 / WU24) TaxID=2059318 RepID=UPI000157D530|nr:predicted protein [Histoplasma mississippiense (nom. inval.)]EDN05293.1 predicted protein [Histoplasma mississippiense (nom. inval.)]
MTKTKEHINLQGTENIASSTDPHQKLPFDTQSLRDLVIRAGVVTRSLKEVVRKAEGSNVYPATK